MILSNKNDNKFSIDETTFILKTFGLSKSKGITQRLIREGKLKAEVNGKNPDDRRSSHSVYERDLYDFVIKSIPSLKVFYERIAILEKENRSLQREIKALSKTSTNATRKTAAQAEEKQQ